MSIEKSQRFDLNDLMIWVPHDFLEIADIKPKNFLGQDQLFINPLILQPFSKSTGIRQN